MPPAYHFSRFDIVKCSIIWIYFAKSIELSRSVSKLRLPFLMGDIHFFYLLKNGNNAVDEINLAICLFFKGAQIQYLIKYIVAS